MMRKILLSEMMAVNEILSFRNIPFSIDDNRDSITLDEWHEAPDSDSTFQFNRDYYALFADDIDLTIKENTIGGMKESLPFAVGGTEIFVRICSQSHKLCTIEQMFGCSISLEYYKRYIDLFNAKIQSVSRGVRLPVIPTRKSGKGNNSGYLRFWVFDKHLTMLYYPESSSPIGEVEIEEFYRHSDGEMDIHWNNDRIVAVDAWMEYSPSPTDDPNIKLLLLPKDTPIDTPKDTPKDTPIDTPIDT